MANGRTVSFATLLRRLRVAAGLTQKDLAELVPRADNLHRLVTALQLDAETRALFVAAAGRRIAGARAPESPMPPAARAAPSGPAGHPRLPPLVGRAASLAQLLESDLTTNR